MTPRRFDKRRKSNITQRNHPYGRKPWSAKDDNLLSEMKQRGLSNRSIHAAFPRRSYAALIQRWSYLRRESKQENGVSNSTYDTIPKLCEHQNPARRKHWVTVVGDTTPRVRATCWWSEAEDAVLRNGKQNGLSCRKISKLVGRSESACHFRWGALQEDHSRPRSPWSERERSLLIEFKSQGLSWLDISRALGRSRSTCLSHFRVLKRKREENARS